MKPIEPAQVEYGEHDGSEHHYAENYSGFRGWGPTAKMGKEAVGQTWRAPNGASYLIREVEDRKVRLERTSDGTTATVTWTSLKDWTLAKPKEVESASVEICEVCGWDDGTHFFDCSKREKGSDFHVYWKRVQPKEVESGEGLPPLDFEIKPWTTAILSKTIYCRERQLKASLQRERELRELLNRLINAKHLLDTKAIDDGDFSGFAEEIADEALKAVTGE